VNKSRISGDLNAVMRPGKKLPDVLWEDFLQQWLVEAAAPVFMGAALDRKFWRLIFRVSSLDFLAGWACIIMSDEMDHDDPRIFLELAQGHSGL